MLTQHGPQKQVTWPAHSATCPGHAARTFRIFEVFKKSETTCAAASSASSYIGAILSRIRGGKLPRVIILDQSAEANRCSSNQIEKLKTQIQ